MTKYYAQPITASPITARPVAARGVSTSGGESLPWLFRFDSKLTALPEALQRMNATYTRNSEKRVPQDGGLVVLPANQFGTSYDDVTGLYGYVPEPAATNLATNSDGDASTYTVSNVVDGTVVPGFSNGLAFGDNSVIRLAYKSASITTGTTYSVSVFVVMNDGGAPVVGITNSTGDLGLVIDSRLVNSGTALIRYIGNGVYRVSATMQSVNTGNRDFGVIKYTGQSARTFRITGIQVETGLRATSYIATTGSTASRAADVDTVLLSAIPGYAASGYTLFVDFRVDAASGADRTLISVDDGTANNRARIMLPSGGGITTAVTVGGVDQTSINAGSVGTSRIRAAFSCSANSFLRAVNGVAGTADTSGSMIAAPTHLRIGCRYDNTQQANCYEYTAGLIPQALTQAQINALTVL